MSTVWKGTLEFGLVSVPVRMTVAAKPEKVDIRLINPTTGAGVKQRWVDGSTGEEVKRDALARAADVDACTVLLADDELAELQPEECSEIRLSGFVRSGQVDPMYFSGSYYLLPNGDDATAYRLVAKALRPHGRGFAAVGTFVRLQRRHHVLIRSVDGVLVLHTLYHVGEVRYPEELTPALSSPEDLRLAQAFMRSRAVKWDPSLWVDEYRQRLLELLRGKREEQAGNLTAELQASVETAKKRKR